MKTDRRFWQVSFLSLLLVALLYLGYQLSGVLNPILVAIVTAYILNPLIVFLEKKGLSRMTAVILVFLVLSLIFITSLVFLIPTVYYELKALVELLRGLNYGKIANTIIDWASRKLEQWNRRFPSMEVKKDVVIARIQNFLQNNLQSIGIAARDVSLSLINIMGSGFSVIGTVLSYLVLFPVYTFFFLLHLDEIWDGIKNHLPIKHETRILEVLNKIHTSISGFFRGQLLVCLIKAIFVATMLSIFNIQYALILGALAFFGSFVPFLIMLISFLPAVIIVLATHGLEWIPLIEVACVYGAVDILEGTVLYPFIVGKEAGVHPLLIIVSLLIGGNLFGFFGVLLSIPIGSTVVILVKNVVLPNLKEVMGRTSSSTDSSGTGEIPGNQEESENVEGQRQQESSSSDESKKNEPNEEADNPPDHE